MAIIINLKKGIPAGFEFVILSNNNDNNTLIYLLKIGLAAAAV